MNELSERRTEELLTAAATDPARPELADSMQMRTRIHQLASGDHTIRRRVWTLWHLLQGQKLGIKDRRNNEFLAALSHELRNCLSAVRNAAGILERETVSVQGTQARLLIERQVGLMTRLIEDLLDVSRIRNGQLHVHRERMDLCLAAVHAVHSVEFLMQQRHHQLTTTLPPGPLWIMADAARLEQVLVNLLTNAAKYTNPGGTVSLVVEQSNGEATIRVVDTGIGMTRDVLPHVFDLFMQVDPASRRADAGLGIGLALVRTLVERHEGSITATSRGPGLGSEFAIRLPLPA